MKIDTHIHLYDPSWGDYAWPPRDTEFHRLISLADYHTEAPETLPIVVGCSQEYALNEHLAVECDRNSLAAAFVAQLDPRDENCVRDAEKLARHSSYRGFRAVNEHILEAPERFIKAAECGRLVEIQGNYRQTLLLYPLFAAHPEISFVIEHYAGYLFDGKPTEPDYAPFLKKMASLPNVSIKVSGLFTLCRLKPKPLSAKPFAETVSLVLKAFGKDRCMYGSDWPVLGVSAEVAESVTREIASSVFPGAADAVMGDNARRIYGL